MDEEAVVGERVKADAAVSFVMGAEAAQEGAVMEDKNTNMRAALEIDEDPIDLEAFEQESLRAMSLIHSSFTILHCIPNCVVSNRAASDLITELK